MKKENKITSWSISLFSPSPDPSAFPNGVASIFFIVAKSPCRYFFHGAHSSKISSSCELTSEVVCNWVAKAAI